MKTIKPQKLGVLTRVLESDQRHYLVVTVFAFVALDNPSRLLTEVAMWTIATEALGPDAALDEGLSKANGEVLVTGSCFPPGGAPKPVSYARVAIGSVDKKLVVVGDREWRRGVPTDPAPFAEMPIRWTGAFGGQGFAQNPAGKGFAPITTDQGERHPLPNIEDPARLITSPKDRPPPAGFGALDPTWPQRISKAGTYDTTWLETRFPGLARDLDPSYFNVAPEDQRVKGYFQGGEPFTIENMNRDKSLVEGRLPAIAARAFINHKTSAGEALRELKTRLDTVHFFPSAGSGYAVLSYRGMIEVAEDDAADVVHLLIAADDPSAPRSVEHYKAVLHKRLDKRRGAIAALGDAELLPPFQGEATQSAKIQSGFEEHEGLFKKRLTAKRDREREEARAYVLEKGLRPADYGLDTPHPEEPLPSADDPDALVAFLEEQEKVAEEKKREAEEKKQQAEAEGRALAAKYGVDFDKMMDDAKKRGAGPPKFSADAELSAMRAMLGRARAGGVPMAGLEARANDPSYEATMRENEQKLKDVYRRFAHYQPAIAEPAEDARERLRQAALSAIANGESLRDRDLSGVSLAGEDLAGKDLSFAFMEGADLAGANLTGANLRGVVLARAKLTEASFTGADLSEANLGGADLAGAKLDGAKLDGAILSKANLTGATLVRASLARADMMESTLTGADLSNAIAPELTVLRGDLDGAIFAGASLDKARFIEARANGANFSGASLEKASFVTTSAEGAIFRDARAKGLVAVYGSTLARADFEGADLDGANVMGTALNGAKFDRASLAGTNMMGCDLRGASFVRAKAPSIMLMKANLAGAALLGANLMSALASKADLSGADMTGANVFRADLSLTRTDAATKMDGAHTKQARFLPRRRDDVQG